MIHRIRNGPMKLGLNWERDESSVIELRLRIPIIKIDFYFRIRSAQILAQSDYPLAIGWSDWYKQRFIFGAIRWKNIATPEWVAEYGD